MLFLRIRITLVFEGAEGGDDPGTGVGGFDDGVNVAALGGHEWIGEAIPELGDFFLAQDFALGFGRLIQFAFVDECASKPSRSRRPRKPCA